MADPRHLDILSRGVAPWNAWRRQHPDVLPNLSGAHLHAAELSTADLSGTNLVRANLSKASLTSTNLTWANVSEADLTEADLSAANLADARLSDSDLSRARLAFAHLARTDLTGAVFSGAIFGRTSFLTLDLSKTSGLSSAIHVAPSSLSVDTLYRSQGRIPKAFLTGCGLPHDFLAATRHLFSPAFDFYSVFISYSHRDKPFARRLYDQLQSAGIRCWLDQHQLLPGDSIAASVHTGIRLWDKVLLCCSRAALQSPWVEWEIEKVLEKEATYFEQNLAYNPILFPLLLDDFLLSGEWESPHAKTLADRLAADFSDWRDPDLFSREFERLLQGLRVSPSEMASSRVHAEVLAAIGSTHSSAERFHVIPSEGRWVVRREGATQALRILDSQQAAVDLAKQTARRAGVEEVVVHRIDGTVRLKIDVQG